MTINIVCVGNLKEKFSKDEQAEYMKRLSAFCKLNVIEIKEQNQMSSIPQILEKEGEEIIQKLSGYVILCDLDGEQVSSMELSDKISSLKQKTSTITFVVGGSYGVSEQVKKCANERISFSKMTFPHNLFRIMLLEQIYRSFMIQNRKSYHK